jgi:pyruvate ferredoxin oxidoreductase beta subunit
MNTGVQSSTGTPKGVKTSTDPAGKKTAAKNLMGIVDAHNLSYYATASPAFLPDLQGKLEKAKNASGFRFIMVDGPCPPGHKHDPDISIQLARLAVETRYFPLFEAENGKFNITHVPEEELPVSEYMKPQGRFAELNKVDSSNGLSDIQKQVDTQWRKLLDRQQHENAGT